MSDAALIHYINTDLILEADADLTTLISFLEERGLWPLHVTQEKDGSWSGTLETDEGFSEPESNVVVMLDVLETLEEPLRETFDLCSVRRFDVGYESGEKPGELSQKISNATLQRIAAVGGSLAITIYPASPVLKMTNLSQKQLTPKRSRDRRRRR